MLKNSSLIHVYFLLGLLFNPKDKSGMFLRNVGSLWTDNMALYPKRKNSSQLPLWERQVLAKHSITLISKQKEYG
jgi:hypothetical protein